MYRWELKEKQRVGDSVIQTPFHNRGFLIIPPLPVYDKPGSVETNNQSANDPVSNISHPKNDKTSYKKEYKS